ncbi:MAG: hypothetical protein NT012_00140 [Candidatus Nealsonbacteria bacterium]|nr:hypothetical protein [Candidatus Nealsonbacteria bacterium]
MEEENKKLEFLKKEKVRTMQKDIASLEELGSQRESEEREEVAVEKTEEKIEAVAKEEEKERQEKLEKLLAEKRAAAQAEIERAKEEEERKKIAEEEMKKRVAEEEERRRKEEKLLAERTEEEKIAEIDKEIENIGLEKKRVNEEKERFLAGIKNFEIQLEPILKEEEIIENKILEIEELEKTAPFEKRSQIEKKRWETDAKRRDIEKTKWSIQEEIEKTEEKIKTIELKYQEVLKKEERFKAEKEKIFRKRQEKESTREKSLLKNEIFQLIDEKKIIENKENELLAKKNRIETELKELLKEEQITEEVIRDIEKREKEISDPKEQRKVEKDRWKVEDDRKTLEGKRWELEQEKKDFSTELKKIEEEYQKILEKETPLRERLKEINRLLRISPGEESLEKEEEKEEMITEDKKKLFEKLEEEKTTIGLEKRAVTQVPTPKFDSEEQIEIERAKEKEERKKIAEEEMRKRIAEEEERRRKEKLLAEKRRLEENQIKITEENPPFENSEVKEDKSSSSATELSHSESEGEKEARLFDFAATRTIKEETSETLIPKLPKKPSPIQKILIRALIFAILLSVIGFLYWFFTVKKVEQQKIILPPEEKKEEERNKYPEIIIPASLISVDTTETLEIMNSSEIPGLLPQLLEKTFETGEYIRILFKNINENKVVGLKEFFEAFEVKTPEKLLEKLNNDFTLFIFSSGNKNHLGFVTKIENKENLLNSLFSWEATMEKDTEKLFEVLGKEKPALSSSFKTSFHQEISFRFLTISQEDFGICYAWFDDYFVFTSSFENIKKTIDLIKASTLENQVGQMFIIGFEGKTVTPQLEEFFHKYKPGGILLLSKNIESAEQLKKLTKDLQNLSLRETGLPLFITIDQEGEIISRVDFLQEKTLQSEIEDTDEAYQIGLTRGQELKELGINLNLAPLLDVTEETDFLFNRSFQKNAARTGNLAKSLIEGQKTANILTAVKHFPGYGGISFNPEETLAKTETLPEIFQFKKAIEANPEFIMTANMVYKNLDPNLLFTFSPTAIQFLKDNLGSEIIIISDDLAQKYLLANFSLKDIMIKPVQAGVNLLIFSGWEISVSEGLDIFFDTFKKGGVSQSKIKESLSKIIKIKERLM